MHALLVAFGVAGDVHPFISLAMALRAAGHRVTLASDEPYRPLAASSGLDFLSLGAAPQVISARTKRDLTHHMRASIAYMRDIVIPRLPAMHATLDAFAAEHRPDVIACHHTAFCVPWIASRRSIPWAMAAVAPCSWTSIDRPNVYPGMPDRDRMPRLISRVGVSVGSWATARAIDPSVNAVRRTLGLPPARRALFDEMFSGGANLGLWSPHFRPPAADDKPRSHIVGFPWFDAAADDAWREPVERFLASGPPPVLITLGTSVPHAVTPFLAAAASACHALGARSLLLAGRPEFIPPSLPSSALALPYAPFSQILPRCTASVHHGGLGTLSRSLRAGVPMVCVPHLHDQFDNAARSRRLGASLTVDRRHADPRQLAAAIRRVLNEPTFREAARRLSASLATEDGGSGGAQVLQVLAAAR
jgi:UDP:flavonoid glycosyltransferase YjiC (YdhE family)